MELSTHPIRANKRRRRRKAEAAALLLTLTLTATASVASQGDRSHEFQRCLSSCTTDNCGTEHIDDGVVHTTHALPLVLRATFWSCTDDCKYHCTHRITNDAYARVHQLKQHAWHRARYVLPTPADSEQQRLDERSPADRRAEAARIVAAELAQLAPVQKEMVQFYGKWVFIRFLGLQEPFSVLFSALNLREHLIAFYKLRRDVPDAYPLKLVYILHALVSVNAWTWSAVFHSRDKPLTERLDYFSAASVLLSGLFFTICRLFRLEPGSRAFSTLLRSFAAVFLVHCVYLSIGRFDYGYNILACLFVAAVHEMLWFAFSFRPALFSPANPLLERYHSNRAAYRASKPHTSNIASASVSGGGAANGNITPLMMATTSSSSPLPAPAASPAATYKGHSPSSSTPPSALLQTNGGSSLASSTLAMGPPSSSPEARRDLQRILLLLLLAMSFEVFDFPPIGRALDAHSLWHLATVPLARMWYDWLIRDARECVFSGWFVGDPLGASASRAVHADKEDGGGSRTGAGAGAGAGAGVVARLGSRMLQRPSDDIFFVGNSGRGGGAEGGGGGAGAGTVDALLARFEHVWSSGREWATDALRGQNGSLEFHALTAKLNEFAGRAAGFAGSSSSSSGSRNGNENGNGNGNGNGSRHGSRHGRGVPGSSSASTSISTMAGVGVGVGLGEGVTGIHLEDPPVGLVKRSEREEKGKEVVRDGILGV
ncbi:unnamed protein product [Tilletia controversa]|uniref:Post-GPI attachment to proteins factor 3 n=3 Tax=Tilletia TaxID=13289 RepID=A0A8X7MSB0_9BASI|nr:hypothetical protein CF336_g4686 [Tilletia laevis]KAE8204133.1 hypothetical protein CF328_g1264 [Tilletia controversa]KAE8263790.1 hypothetical protein A4X03_0g1426 [Tilletia caries]KAE8200841.1 hypothetical protein CF335_g3869 [Tilletia laevis]KAE8246180.1 hypothetical protein A4X06_0g5130 [Tilletia controversa]